MQIAEQAVSPVREARHAAVAETMERIRAIERERGVNREALEEIKGVLMQLAARRELFPEGDFPPAPNGKGHFPVYRLSEDDDHRFALYLSASIGEKDVPPHDHTTWAVITGVQGEEENRFYERTDDGATPGRGTLRRTGGETVRPGVGLCLMPEDIHSIHPRNQVPSYHLHCYGLALERLSGRVTYDMEAGTYRVYPASPNIIDAR